MQRAMRKLKVHKRKLINLFTNQRTSLASWNVRYALKKVILIVSAPCNASTAISLATKLIIAKIDKNHRFMSRKERRQLRLPKIRCKRKIMWLSSLKASRFRNRIKKLVCLTTQSKQQTKNPSQWIKINLSWTRFVLRSSSQIAIT